MIPSPSTTGFVPAAAHRLSSAALLLLTLGGGAFPQERSGQPAVPVVSLRETAAVLARSGAANNDARTVLAAARIMLTAERSSPSLERSRDIREEGLRPEEEAKAGSLTAAGLLRLATRIAVDQQDAATARIAARLAASPILGLGDAELAEELGRAAAALDSVRGARGGPIWADGHLASGQLEEFELTFEGGYVPNVINVSPSNADGDLDCYLYDGDELVARDSSYDGRCSIRWSQKFEGTLTLRVRNTGAGTYYVMLSN